MKKLTILLGLAFAASITLAADTKEQAKADAKAKADVAQLPAQVVSVDRDAKTITVKNPEATAQAAYEESLTLPVQGKAAGSLKNINSGDHITLTCKAGNVTTASATANDSDTAKPSSMSRTEPQPGALARLGQCTSVTEISKMKASASASSSSSATASAAAPPATSTLSAESQPSGVAPSAYGSSADSAFSSSSTPSVTGKELVAEVVSADESSQTLTLKAAGAAGIQESRTLAVDTSAVAALGTLQSGQKVRITCRQSMAPSVGISGSAGSSSASAAVADLAACSSVTTIASVAESSTSSARTSSFDSAVGSETASAASAVDPEGKQRTSSSATTSTHAAARVNAVVVATDATANTITVHNPGTAAPPPTSASTATDASKGDSLTLPVEGKATAALKTVKAGDRVMLTCRDGAGSAPVSTSDTATSGTSKIPSSTKDTTSGATASGDSGWAMAKAGKCAAVTDISKTAATTTGTETDTMKSPSKPGEAAKPKKNY